MGTKTTHYNLDKPATNDVVDVRVLNSNFDTLDATLYEHYEGVSTRISSVTNPIAANVTNLTTRMDYVDKPVSQSADASVPIRSTFMRTCTGVSSGTPSYDNGVYYKFVLLTAQQYADISTKDPSTIYLITR